ncbi:hypothetical protein [Mucilaginibacter arboris]|uniref:Uncharacterized protein n=1 Tax=Mucilaginibacter arboris TaxID=2682090 RepID=A0A7K1SZX6_9SPHI|nr:hypothetical protein [Mucilaginibacter arboris]MVN22872.1 hypothetical protein [Mucilaginibacter arboris]
MYGGNFKQYFGWYIQQTKSKLGIQGVEILEDKCPQDLIELIKSLTGSGTIQVKNNEDDDLYDSFEYGMVNKAINKYVENITREEFGFKKIGESWISESMLYNIIKKLFPNNDIIRHYRPSWLERLELDIFIPKLSIGFEYQGQQHFHPVDTWGGKQALENLQERDKLKRELCLAINIRLIKIDYTEPLTEARVLSKIFEL